MFRGNRNTQFIEHYLPGWSSSALPVSIISPLASNSSARLKLTLDSLALELKNALAEQETV